MDTYLTLDDQQQQNEFEQGLTRLNQGKQEVVMQIVTSWMREGIKQGRIEGKQEGKQELVLRQLARRFGALTPAEESRLKTLNGEQLETLGEDFLDFQSRTDLTAWLDAHTAAQV